MAADGDAPRFTILGPVRAWRGADEIDLGPAKQRALLAVLLLEANHPVPVGRIVAAVWNDQPPENGANVVQKYVAGLRRALEPDRSPRAPGRLIVLDDAGYRLAVAPGQLDTTAFADAVRAGRAARDAGRLDEAADRLRGALDRWTAPPLAGLTGPVFDLARARLADQRAEAWEALADVEARRGRLPAVVPELVRAVSEFPAREELRHHLMDGLHQAGRRAEALDAFRDARRHLVEEYGVEPGARLQDLHRRLLRDDARIPRQPPGAAPVPAAPVTAAPGPVAPGPAAPGPEAAPAGSGGWRRTLAIVLSIATPLVSVGLLSWLAVGWHAARRRSVGLWVCAAVYLGIVATSFVFLDEDDATFTTAENIAFGFVFAAALIAAVQGGVLAATDPGRRTSRTVTAAEQRAKRAQARQILVNQPQVAHDLAIGRPDLPRWFDDGGLVDVNAVPEGTLAALPGVGAERARLIVRRRATRGPIGSTHDLVVEGLLSPDAVPQVDELLVFRR